MTDNLRALHEAATPAPWGEDVTGINSPTGAALSSLMDYGDAALIAALRNAYANGDLIERAVLERVIKSSMGWWRFAGETESECVERVIGEARALVERNAND